MPLFKMALIEKRTQVRVIPIEVDAETEELAAVVVNQQYGNCAYDEELEEAVPGSSNYSSQVSVYRADGAYNTTPDRPLEDEETLDLLNELRWRGVAVAAFSPDDVPAWADYSGVGGADAWFDSVSERLLDRLCSAGNDTLDIFASNQGLPMQEPDEEI